MCIHMTALCKPGAKNGGQDQGRQRPACTLHARRHRPHALGREAVSADPSWAQTALLYNPKRSAAL